MKLRQTLLCLLTLMVASNAALPLDAYQELQDSADEYLNIEVLSSVRDSSAINSEHSIGVTLEAAVTQVHRSKNSISVNDTIEITYKHYLTSYKDTVIVNGEEKITVISIDGPGSPFILEAGDRYPAFLSKNENETFRPAAYFFSFKSELSSAHLPSPLNFSADHYYVMPGNYYKFSWDSVISDSLVDYALYANSRLFYTTSETSTGLSYHQLDSLFVEAGGAKIFFPDAGTAEGNSVEVYAVARYGSSLVQSPNSESVTVKVIDAVSITKDLQNGSAKSSILIRGNCVSSADSKPFSLKIYSANGRLLKDIAKSESSISLNTLGLAKGIYHLRVVQGTDLFTQQFIVR